MLPNIQSKPSLVQLEGITSCPVTCHLVKETHPQLSATSFQVAVEGDEVKTYTLVLPLLFHT